MACFRAEAEGQAESVPHVNPIPSDLCPSQTSGALRMWPATKTILDVRPCIDFFLLTSLELLDMLSQLRCKCPQVETPKPKLEIRSYTQVPTSRDPKTETRNPKSLNPKPFTKGVRSSGLLGSGSIEFYHYPKKSKHLSPKHPQNLPIGPKVVPFWDSLIEF